MFIQTNQGDMSVDKTLFVADVSAGKVKIASQKRYMEIPCTLCRTLNVRHSRFFSMRRILEQSSKRTSRCAAKYYTHDRSYYPQSAMPLFAISTMAPLPSEDITPYPNPYPTTQTKTLN